MHPMKANQHTRDNSWPKSLPDWAYTYDYSSGDYMATNMRTGEVWYRWKSDQLYHPNREPRKSSIESVIALICYAAVISAAVAAICIGISWTIIHMGLWP